MGRRVLENGLSFEQISMFCFPSFPQPYVRSCVRERFTNYSGSFSKPLINRFNTYLYETTEESAGVTQCVEMTGNTCNRATGVAMPFEPGSIMVRTSTAT